MGLFDKSSSKSTNVTETTNQQAGADVGAALSQGGGTAASSGGVVAGDGSVLNFFAPPPIDEGRSHPEDSFMGVLKELQDQKKTEAAPAGMSNNMKLMIAAVVLVILYLVGRK